MSAAANEAAARASANLRAWEHVLSRLEADVEATEELLRSPEGTPGPRTPEPWQSPALDGPVPDQLLGRARALHARQTALREALAEAVPAARARREQARRAVGLGARSTGSPSAAYVNVSA